jgi:hypothetical protein
MPVSIPDPNPAPHEPEVVLTESVIETSQPPPAPFAWRPDMTDPDDWAWALRSWMPWLTHPRQCRQHHDPAQGPYPLLHVVIDQSPSMGLTPLPCLQALSRLLMDINPEACVRYLIHTRDVVRDDLCTIAQLPAVITGRAPGDGTAFQPTVDHLLRTNAAACIWITDADGPVPDLRGLDVLLALTPNACPGWPGAQVMQAH